MTNDGGFVMETRRKQAVILTGSPIGIFYPVTRPETSCNPIIPMVFFGIPPTKHTVNPKSAPI